jgi:arginine decarboxylase
MAASRAGTELGSLAANALSRMRQREEAGFREAGPPLDHSQAPYFDALRAYAEREPGRFHGPGHKGGAGTDAELRDALGPGALALDLPLVIHGVDIGVAHTPLELARELAADAWGANCTWFLSNGATQGNHAICLALASLGTDVVVQRNVHASTIDGLVLAGLRPTWVSPELNSELGIAHCLTPETLDITLADAPGAVAAMVVSPTYYGAVADIRGLAHVAHSWGVPLIVDEAWGSHFPFHEELPEHALASGADVVLCGTHTLVGSLAQSAMMHLGRGVGERIDERILDRALTLVSSTSPSSLLLGSLDAARRNAVISGRDLIGKSIRSVNTARETISQLPGLDVLDERLLSHPGVHAYDPLRLAIDVRGSGATGYELAALLREESDINLEFSGEHMLVAVFGMAEQVEESCTLLVSALREASSQINDRVRSRKRRALPRPPRWGPLAMTPREAFMGVQEIVPIEGALGRVAAESLAAFPPGIPNVVPGERLTAETLSYIRRTLEQGGAVRGLSDPTLRTIRVAVES